MSSAQNPDADREDYVVSVLEFAGDPGAATAALQRVFGLGEPEARSILSQVPVEVRRGVNRIRAEYFRRALELSGARVEVRDGDGVVVTAAAARAQATQAVNRPRAQPTGPVQAPAQPSAAGVSPRDSQTVTFGGPANDPGRSSSGGWGDLERVKPAAKPVARKPSAPIATSPATEPNAAIEAPKPAEAPKAAAARPMSTEDRFVLDLGTEAGPLDSPLTAPLEGGALELASLRPASRNRPVNEGRSIEIEGESAPPGPSLELALDASDPEASRLRGVIEKKKPAVAAGPRNSSAGERDAAKGEPVSATRPRTNARPASTAIDPNAVARDLDPARPRPRPASSAVDPNAVPARDLDPARPRPRPAPSAIDPDAAPAHDLDPARPRPRPAASAVDPNAGPPRNVDPARVSDLHLKAAPADETGARVRPGRASADPDLKAAQAPSATHIADARANHAAGPGRPSATSLPDGRVNRGRAPIRPTLGFWDAAMLGFSGTSVSWIAKIGGATVVLAGLAQLSMLLPGVGVPLLLIGLTCLLGLCSEYHRHVFWAAATRERELNERPALSVVNMMRDGFHLAALAVVSQALLWFWLAGQLQAGHRPIAIVFSPTLWVLGFGPGFYWPIALACAAAQNQATGVWNFARGFRALGRAPGAIAAVVLTTAVAFMLSWMVMAAVISPTALDPTCALVTAAGLPIAISHALAGALMGRAVHERPQLFE